MRNDPRELHESYAIGVYVGNVDGMALLIVTSSPASVCRSVWSKGMVGTCHRAGVGEPNYRIIVVPLRCAGVGKGTQQLAQDVTYSISVGDGNVGAPPAPGLPMSRASGQWGHRLVHGVRAQAESRLRQVRLDGE